MMTTERKGWPLYSECEAEIVKRVLLSNKVNYWTGEEGRLFEKEFASFVGTEFAVAVANGTVALDLALMALDIGSGDEVIVTSRTFLASVSTIVNSGATPVFADVSRESQNIMPEKIAELITEKTRAVICVHLAGWPCDMDEIKQICSVNDLYVIEDCAQAHGAMYKGQPVGSIGDVAAFSFCQDKIMSTGGEGGMVTTNRRDLWEKIWSFKDHGKNHVLAHTKTEGVGFKWLHDSFGTNWRMTEIQAALGRYQLTQMSEWSDIRTRFQEFLWSECRDLPGIRVPRFECSSCSGCESPEKRRCKHAAYKAYVFVRPEELNDGWDRDRVISTVNEAGISCFQGSCSEVYLEKAFDNGGFRPSKRLPNARSLGETSLMFLVHPTLTIDNMRDTVQALKSVMRRAATIRER